MTSGDRASFLGHDNPLTATVTGILDRLTQRSDIVPLPADLDLSAQKILITGANAGLGYAIAEALAKRGASLVLACRSGIPETAARLTETTGNPRIRMEQVDLGDLDSVASLAARLASAGDVFDAAIFNAGLMPRQGYAGAQGFEIMFTVHYLANHLLVRLLLGSGTIPNATWAGQPPDGRPARLVFVASEAHRSARALDWPEPGAFRPYGLRDGMKQYGVSKLALLTFVSELTRRLAAAQHPDVAVHSLCPGPVASSIARDAPAWLEPILRPAMRWMFNAPTVAAEPVLWLAASPEIEHETGIYLHMKRRRAPSPEATDPNNGRRLWEWGEQVLAPWLDATP
ncbi:MAG: SDR family NAD(P)-dependent oxidoreductase [Candidatus Dadabacteria bacterium]|nr:MAG: SDR family NAD(P)-dependent oxidoreductase [Candidatus Dadabacteria bacterium]